MSRRARFTGHRDHMGRYIGGMRNVPEPTLPQDDEDDADGVIPHPGLRNKAVGSGVISYRKPPNRAIKVEE